MSSVQFCTSCGTQISGDTSFCSECGRQVEVSVDEKNSSLGVRGRYKGWSKKKKILAWVGAVFVVLVIASVLTPGTSSTEATNDALSTSPDDPVNEALSAITESFDTLKDSAEPVTYDDLFRNNELHVGKIVYYRGKTVQVIDGGNGQYQLRINVTEDSFFWTDTLFVQYTGARLLDGDIVEFVAEVVGLLTYSATFGNEITIPHLAAVDLRLELEPPPPTVTPVLTANPTPGFSRGVPVALGTAVQVTRDGTTIEVTLVDVIRGEAAWTMLQSANRFNDPAPDGSEYLLTSVRVHVLETLGVDDSLRVSGFEVDIVSGSGIVYDNVSVIAPDPNFSGELFLGGTLTGWIGHSVDVSDSNPLMRYKLFFTTSIWFNLTE